MCWIWAYAPHISFTVLISAGANLDVANSGGFTPLHHASQEGHLEAVKILVNAGANTKLRTGAGLTAEDIARNNGHEDIVEYLSQL